MKRVAFVDIDTRVIYNNDVKKLKFNIINVI